MYFQYIIKCVTKTLILIIIKLCGRIKTTIKFSKNVFFSISMFLDYCDIYLKYPFLSMDNLDAILKPDGIHL